MALFHTTWNVGRALGPLLAVGVIALSSYSVVFWINAFSCLAVVIAAYRMAPPVRHPLTGTHPLQLLARGWRTVRRQRVIALPTSALVMHYLLVAPFIALIPALAQIALHGTPKDTALLYLGQGFGSAVGGLALAAMAVRYGNAKVFVVILVLTPVTGMLFALSPMILVAIMSAIPLSALHAAMNANASTMIQRTVDPVVRGSVTAVLLSVSGLAAGIGGATQGLIAEHVGVRTTLFGGSMIMFLLVAAAFVVHRRTRDDSAVTM